VRRALLLAARLGPDGVPAVGQARI
jgi:hypothetical protein